MNGVAVASPRAAARPGAAAAAALILVALVSLMFVAREASPYLSFNEAQYRQYWPLRGWLLLHIAGGMIALLTGPGQLWLGLTDRVQGLHRALGYTYLSAIGLSSIAAYYLALHTSGGIVFGSGLAGLATAWLITSGMAVVAIKRHLYEQHREWMIRSYVVTTGFVTFRVIITALGAANIGTRPEQLGISAWFCWAVPLLVTEAVLQGRRIARVRPD